MKEKVGIYGGLIDKDEVLLINDIDIAKRMLIKDFDYFMDRTNLGLKFDHNKLGDRIFANMFIVQKGDMLKFHGFWRKIIVFYQFSLKNVNL